MDAEQYYDATNATNTHDKEDPGCDNTRIPFFQIEGKFEIGRGKHPLLCGHVHHGGLWIGVWHWRFIVCNHKVMPMLFSERNGMREGIRHIGSWHFEITKI